MDNGFDDKDVIQDITEADLERMNVKIGHRKRIHKAIKKECKSQQPDIVMMNTNINTNSNNNEPQSQQQQQQQKQQDVVMTNTNNNTNSNNNNYKPQYNVQSQQDVVMRNTNNDSNVQSNDTSMYNNYPFYTNFADNMDINIQYDNAVEQIDDDVIPTVFSQNKLSPNQSLVFICCVDINFNW